MTKEKKKRGKPISDVSPWNQVARWGLIVSMGLFLVCIISIVGMAAFANSNQGEEDLHVLLGSYHAPKGLGNSDEGKNETISHTEKIEESLYSIIKETFKSSDDSIHISDEYYNRIGDDEMVTFLKEDNTNLIVGKDEIFDCDDYTLHLMSAARMYFAEENKNAAFGLIWTNDHAANFYVNLTYVVHVFDPQTEEVYLLEDQNVTFVYI